MSRHPARSPSVFSPTTLNILLGVGVAGVVAGIVMLTVGLVVEIPEPRDTNLLGCGGMFVVLGLFWSALVGGIKAIDAHWDRVWEEEFNDGT